MKSITLYNISGPGYVATVMDKQTAASKISRVVGFGKDNENKKELNRLDTWAKENQVTYKEQRFSFNEREWIVTPVIRSPRTDRKTVKKDF